MLPNSWLRRRRTRPSIACSTIIAERRPRWMGWSRPSIRARTGRRSFSSTAIISSVQDTYPEGREHRKRCLSASAAMGGQTRISANSRPDGTGSGWNRDPCRLAAESSSLHLRRPWFENWRNVDYAKEWLAERDLMQDQLLFADVPQITSPSLAPVSEFNSAAPAK